MNDNYKNNPKSKHKNLTHRKSFHVFLSDEEAQILEDKYKDSGMCSKSAFLRQLILEGFVLETDFSEIQRYNFLLSNISNNINQVAHRCNETRSVYRSDIEQLQKEMKKLWQLQKSMLSMLPSAKR